MSLDLDRPRRLRRWHLAFSAVTLAVVVALVVAFTGSGSPQGDDTQDLSAGSGPGRALQGDNDGDVEAVDAGTADASSEDDAAFDSDDPNVNQLQMAGSSELDVRRLHGKVEKVERPEHEVEFGGEEECEEAADEAECEAESGEHAGEDCEEAADEAECEQEAEAAEEAAQEAAQDAAEEEAPSTGGVPDRAAPAPAADTTFEGLDYANWGAGHPPDTNGDVGPTYYIQTINTSIGIYRKSDGVRVAAFTFDTFMSQGSFGNLCDTDNFGDPVVLYDSFEDRWIITDFAFKLDGGGNVSPQHVYECFAVSQSGDPVTGGWNFYSLETPGGLGDYPKFGVWEDGIYMSANMFGYSASSSFQGTHVWALNKAQMYAGVPNAKVIDFAGPVDDFTLIPANARLQAGTPPPGTPEYFVSNWNFLNAVEVYKLDVDWAHPSAATFSGPDLQLNATSWPNANVANATTPANSLDTLPIRTMAQTQYSNIAGAESLWVTHTVRRGNTSGFAAPRWYQLDVSGGTVAAATLQGTTFDPDAANTYHRYIPSLAVDRLGDLALDYTTSNTTTNPRIDYAGRLAGDPANTFTQGEQTLIAGTGTQSGSCNGTCIRWGDYSGMALDPDGCRFWMTGEYYAVTGLNHQTRIGSFKYPSCTPVGDGTLSGTVTAGGNPASGATVTLGSRTTTTNGSGAYSFTVPSGVYPSVTASLAGFTTGTASSISVPSGGTATQDFALTAPANPGCFTDDSQSDFQTGDPSGCDLNASPGAIQLGTNVAVGAGFEPASQTTGTNFAAALWTGQTFIPTDSGPVTKADVTLFCNGCTGTTPNIAVSLRATSAGLPTGPDLATGTITGFSNSATATYTATFASPVTVTAGTQYALILAPTANPTPGGYFWIRGSPSAYASGSRVTSADSGSSWTADTTRDMMFHVWIDHGYNSTGTFTSSVKDANPAAGSTPNWTTLSFTAATPAGTAVKFQVAASNSNAGPFNYVGPDGTGSTFFTTSGASLDQFDGQRYLRYQAVLTTSDTSVTPSLSDVTLCFADVATTSLAVDPAAGQAGGTAALSATLTAAGVPLSGKTVAFTLNGNSVGSDVTDATGVASLPSASLAGIGVGAYPSGVAASFAGDATNSPSNGTAALTVSGQPAVSPSPGSWDFGDRRVGTTSPGKNFTISNSGNAPLTVSSVALSGTNAGNYTVSAEDCTTSSPIAPAGSCQVTVTFHPSAIGARTASVDLSSNAPSSPTSISLTGNGTEPTLSTSTGTVTFGPQLVGTTSGSQTLTVTNIGGAPLSVSSVAVTGADASQYDVASDACSGQVVAPTATCDVTLTFKPTSTGAHDGANLVLASDDPSSPATVALHGSGVAPALSTSTGTVAFDPQQVGTTSASKTVTVSNSGTAPLSVTSASLTGADASHYHVASDACSGQVVAPAGTCLVTLTFKPTAPGAHNAANLVLASDDPSSPATVALHGSGTGAAPAGPKLSVHPRRAKFGGVDVDGGSKTRQITVTNAGGSALTLSTIELNGGRGSFRLKAKACRGQSLQPGSSCVFKVVFRPRQAGGLAAKVAIASDGGNFTVRFVGFGLT